MTTTTTTTATTTSTTIMDLLLTSAITWIYYTCIFISPLGVDAYGDAGYSSGSYSPQGSRCTFPEAWRGTWFQNGLGDLQIKKHSVSHIGHCVNHGGHNKYLLFRKKDMCFQCLAFTPQHDNLLQYKQSYCVRTDTLEEVCSHITGDFTLHTMVKVSGSPIPCPFQGHYSFTYTNGSEAACDDPPSSIRACADSSKFLFNHRKCPKVSNSYEKVESFQCLAVWDNGVDHYMYGRFNGPLLTTKESQYRCFMYSLYGAHGMMSMTADATCQGLQTPDLGMNVYNLHHLSDDWPQPRCRFPQFLTSSAEWRNIIGNQRYQISKREEVISVWDIEEPTFVEDGESGAEEKRLRISCISEVNSMEYEQLKKVDIIGYVTDDKCDSSYRCIRLTQRTEGVVNIQISPPIRKSKYPSCADTLFTGTEKHLLIPLPEEGVMTPETCPLPGLYSYTDPKTGCNGDLQVGCSKGNQMVVDAKCQGTESADILQCYTSWRENDRMYLIAGPLGNMRKADCLVYKVTPKGYQLEADPTCTNDRIQFMGKSIGFVLNAPYRTCSAVTTRPPQIVQPKTPKTTNRGRPNNNQANNNNNNNNNSNNNNNPNNSNKSKKNSGNTDSNGIYDTRSVGNNNIVDSGDVLDTHAGSGSQSSMKRNMNGGCFIRTYDKFLVIVSLWIVCYFWR